MRYIKGYARVNKNNLIIYVLLGSMFTTTFAFADVLEGKNTKLTIYQVMQRVLERYPSLKISEMEVAQAAEQRRQVESSLGWILNSAAGITHDLTGFGTPSDRFDVRGSIDRQLQSGATLSLSGSYRYEDSSLPFDPLPNPAHTTRLDLSYRLPLAQGEGNPLYVEGIISADAGHDLAKANQLLTRITLAEKVKDLFYSSVFTFARIDNARQDVHRAKQLNVYIKKNVKLGLLDKKDQLQAIAQLDSKLADLSTIELKWTQQQSSLNRLMLEDWGEVTQPILSSSEKYNNYDIYKLIKITENYHPAVTISKAKLQIAESQINSARDNKKDSLDLVVSVGSRTSNGDNSSGSVSELGFAGSVSFEYKYLFDNKGVSSKYKQALLEKNIAIQDIKKTSNDIRYTISGLVAEIKTARLAVKAMYKKLKSESLKLDEVVHRYHSGRADTEQLIKFQNEYSFAELTYQNQKIEMNNRVVALQIFTGQFWNELTNRNAQNGAIK